MAEETARTKVEQIEEMTVCQAAREVTELLRQNTMYINLTAPPYRVIEVDMKGNTLPCNAQVRY